MKLVDLQEKMEKPTKKIVSPLINNIFDAIDELSGIDTSLDTQLKNKIAAVKKAMEKLDIYVGFKYK